MFLRRLKNFANFRIITGTLTTSIMVLGIIWYLTTGGYEAAIAAITGIAGFLGLFRYSFLSFDKNLTADRIALVVGNQNYINTPPLINSVSDADAVCTSLRNLGFRIIKRINPSAEELRKAIYDFQTILSTGGVGLFYYSGHAAQVDGRDYILPVDARLSTREEFVKQAIDLNELLRPVDQIIEESPQNNGSIVIYSTASGTPAFDFFKKPEDALKADANNKDVKSEDTPANIKSQHSPFAEAFLTLVDRWNLEIFDLFRLLLRKVRDATEGHQIPWLSASVDTEFYFKPIIKEKIGILKILIFDACRTTPFYRSPVYYATERRAQQALPADAASLRSRRG